MSGALSHPSPPQAHPDRLDDIAQRTQLLLTPSCGHSFDGSMKLSGSSMQETNGSGTLKRTQRGGNGQWIIKVARVTERQGSRQSSL